MDTQTNEDVSETGTYSLDATFSSLARSDRRVLLRHLLDAAPDPVPRDELATALATDGQTASADVAPTDEQGTVAALHHCHLPKLTAAGLVDSDAADTMVALAEHPALADQGIVDAITGDAPGDTASLDALFAALADAQRRTVLDVLSHQLDTIHVETLARELAARDQGVAESDVTTDDVDAVMVELQHAALPHLAEADLVEYDPDAGTVAYTGHPTLRVAWMHSVFQPALRGSLTGEADPDGIGEIEGRERVVSFGQSLLGRAEDELFCMVTDTELLKAGCLARVRDAARERDVDVYLGIRDPAVRAYVEEHAPEVVLWEPNTNWLNLPVAGDSVGRLVMADREAVMLGTLSETQTDGRRSEEAIVGEGEHNTLVTMIRQLVAPHLEQLDSDTDDVEPEIPL